MTEKQVSQDWISKYNHLLLNIPQPSAIIKTADESLAPFKVSLKEGEKPFIYGMAYVPDEYGCDPLDWFLAKESQPNGLKCIVLPTVRSKLFKEWSTIVALKIKEGVSEEEAKAIPIMVKRFIVFRVSTTGKSVLGEVDR